MKRVLSPNLPKPDSEVELPENEAHHITQVMRLRDGDTVEALDGKGAAVLSVLRVRGKSVFLTASEATISTRQAGVSEVLPIDLEVAILKGDAMEWIVEKAVELGVRSLTPLVTAHTVVQIDRKGPQVFRERWQRIADQTLKQCGRLGAMEIKMPTSLERHLADTASARRIVADERVAHEAPILFDRLTSEADLWRPGIRILIGPEGGWSEKERGLLDGSGSISVSLGPLILRAETACLFSVATAVAFLRKS